jgi:hypothetical protein
MLDKKEIFIAKGRKECISVDSGGVYVVIM